MDISDSPTATNTADSDVMESQRTITSTSPSIALFSHPSPGNSTVNTDYLTIELFLSL